MNPHFTNDEVKKLVLRLKNLEEVCLANQNDMSPTVRFKTKENFDQFDVLRTYQESQISPQDLKYFWEPQSHQNARGLGFIVVNNEKWFYDKVSKIATLFNQEGTKKIELEFPCFIDASKMWNQKETIPVLKKLIQECQKSFPPEKIDDPLFPSEFCQKLYNKTDAPCAVHVAVMEMMEDLRRILIQKLTNLHLPVIQKSKVYKAFIKKNPSPTLSEKEKAIQCLKKEKNAIFLLSEKVGIVKKANRLILYHQIRDFVRHPDEVAEVKATPQKIINDFYEALNLAEFKGKPALSEGAIYQNIAASMAFEYLAELKGILSQKADQNLKYGKEKFWKDLEGKKVLTPSESQQLNKAVKTGNCVAHVHDNAPTAKENLADEQEAVVANMLIKLSDRTY